MTGSLAVSGSAMAASTGPHAGSQTVASRVFQPGGLFKPAPGTHSAIVNGRKIQFSTNWSGYAVTGGTFTTATASWTQNTITCTSGDGSTDMSPWVGIDGFSSNTVEQTGSSGDCNGATPNYYAWYEMFPRNVIIINKTVQPGDKFTGTVTHTTGTSYKLVLQDITQGWTNTVTKSINAKDNSAEAIMEQAATHLTKWASTDPFTGFTVDGQAAGSFSGIVQMEIKSGSTLCDSTSSLSGSENFTATWLNAC
ncbi:MAG TPA: G1 family glutamic endopeptidase [Streptosporangiaceae bacterium]